MSHTAPAKTRVFLFRHGLVAPEDRNRFNGVTEARLDPLGAAQMARGAAFLSSAPPRALYSSPLRRCLESAAVLEEFFELEAEVVDDLQEMNFGLFEGLTFHEIRARHAEDLTAFYNNLAEHRVPEAETMREVQERAWRALRSIVAANPDDTVAVVAHGAVNRLILAKTLQVNIQAILHLAQDYGCLNVLDFWPDRVVVKGLNIIPGEVFETAVYDMT